MSIILKRTTDDSWPDFGEIFMDLEYGVVAMINAVEEVAEHKEGIDG